MSAYIVECETINHILIGLIRADAHNYDYPHLGDLLKSFIGHSKYQELGQQMWDLNRQAVNARYNERTRHMPFRLNLNLNPTRMQVLKSLRCYLYQCDERGYAKKALYRALKTFGNDLAQHIIRDLPEYERCSWG